MEHAIMTQDAPRAAPLAQPLLDADEFHAAPRWVCRTPTTQELLELSHRVYKHSRRLYSEADAQGLRVYHDERLDGSDVRVVMLVPSWFPRPHVPLDTVLHRLEGDSVTVAVVVRGTVRDLVGNTIANLQLLFNKMINDEYLPEAATDTTKVVQGWLLELLARHPELRPPGGAPGSGRGGFGGPEWAEGGVGGGCSGGPARRLRLNVSITGHSLGGLIAECATIESARFADAYGMGWRCVSFESPGVPHAYMQAALRQRPEPGAWDEAITGYLAAPNPINMLYPHLGTVVHVMAQWEQTWSHVARCIGADALRIAGWVAVASLTGAAINHVTGRRGSDDDDRLPALAPAAAAATQAATAATAAQAAQVAQPVIASVVEGHASRAGRALAAVPAAAAEAISRQQCLANPAAAAAAGAGGAAATAAATDGAAVASAAAAAAAAAIHGAASAAVRTGARAGASVGGTVLAAASGAAQTTLRHIGVGMPMGLLAGWALGGGGPIGLAKCLACVLGVEVEELVSQHGLGSMRPCFDSNSGEIHPRFARRMKAWPHLGTRGEVVLKAVTQVARWTLPSFFCHDNVGVWTMLSRSALVEARCSRLEGYEPAESPGDVAFDGVYDIRAADARSGDAVASYSVAPDDVLPPQPQPQPRARAAGAAAAEGAAEGVAAAGAGAFGGQASGVVEMAVVEGGGLPAVAVPAAEAEAERARRREAVAALGAALAAEARRHEAGAALAAGSPRSGPAPLEGGAAAAPLDASGDEWAGAQDWEIVSRARRQRPRLNGGGGGGFGCGGSEGSGGVPSDLMECDDEEAEDEERARRAGRRDMALA